MAESGSTPVVVSPRGQITLPKRLRSRLRLTTGSVLLAREEQGRLVLDPAAVTPVKLYSNAEIARLVAADRVTSRERAAIRRRLGLEAKAKRRRGRG